jgi:hypothetical protein
VANLDAIFRDSIRNKNKNKKEKTNFNTANFSFSAADFNLQRHFSCNNYINKTFYKLNTQDWQLFKEANYTRIYWFKNEVKNSSNQGKSKPQ